MLATASLARTLALAPPGLRAIGALLSTGILIGASVPLARVAGERGVAPLVWVLATSALSSLLLRLARRASPPAAVERASRRAWLGYVAALGLLSIALPNALLFVAVRELGAAAGSLAYTLPPLLTVAIAALVGLERPTRRRILGIVLGLVGTLVLVLPRSALHDAGTASAYLCLALVPVSIAIGNIVRARYWPPGSTPIGNAAGTTLAGALLLGGALAVEGAGTAQLLALATPALAGLALGQAAASAVAMLLFFWLQRAAGPVFTSQVGYVATATGLAAAAVVFGERVSPWFVVAGGLVMLGVVLAQGGGGRAQGSASVR